MKQLPRSDVLAKRFLENLHTGESKEAFETLRDLVEVLENKNDPEETEIRLTESLYHFLEKLSILEANLKSYSKDATHKNKLEELISNISSDGNGRFID